MDAIVRKGMATILKGDKEKREFLKMFRQRRNEIMEEYRTDYEDYAGILGKLVAPAEEAELREYRE